MANIQHLYWRAGFGLSPQQWQEKKDWPISMAIDDLFLAAGKKVPVKGATTTIPKKRLSDEQRVALRKENEKKVRKLNLDWVYRMGNPQYSDLLERMSLFWHGHFACRSRLGSLATAQLNTIREHALGNFRSLAQAIAKDVAMIRYLNNQQNKKKQPNENFARELMELFTIGRGNYTEQDVKEAARAFTGWSSNLAGNFVFRSFQHDYGKKTFFGKTGKYNGDDIIDMILERRETAHFIATKVYRYFVNPKVNASQVQQLANVFYNSNYDISRMMRTLFEADWFYAPENIGVKIKSPVELMAGITRDLNVYFRDTRSLLFLERSLGQVLFNPPNVAGWPGGRTWIDNSTLMLRLNLASYLFNNASVNLRAKDDLKASSRGKAFKRLAAEIDLEPVVEMTTGQSEKAVFDTLCSLFFTQKPKLDQQFIHQQIKATTPAEYVGELTLKLLSLPEYQTC
ncbi:MAG: DUF1800 domain-containing protein [Bacteroidota bacterium]